MKIIFLILAIISSLSAQQYNAKNYSKLLGMPGFNDSLLQMHFTLYEGYVKNANDLMAQLQQMSEEGKSGTFEYGALKRRFGWEFDGMRLHELYFENLGGSGILDPDSSLAAAINTQFGSFEKWKKQFISTGMIRGIGWVALYLDPGSKRLFNCWINEHDGGHLTGGRPILIMDVFEHAYMPQYGLNRAKYIDTFFANIDWAKAASRFSK